MAIGISACRYLHILKFSPMGENVFKRIKDVSF